jgi:hypothetical protein
VGGRIRDRRIPSTRGVEPDLRRRRLLAARKYSAGTVPRLAILLGHWDRGEIVRLGVAPGRLEGDEPPWPTKSEEKTGTGGMRFRSNSGWRHSNGKWRK